MDNNPESESNLREIKTDLTYSSMADIEKPLLPEIALKLIRKTAIALAEASQSGLVHKNLCPDTILVPSEDSSIVLNFDAPLRTPDDKDSDKVYSSPEQRVGKALDSRSNIYTLGIILYELIEGVPPTETLQAATVKDEPKDALPVPTDQTARIIIHKCCRKEPWARYQTLDEFIVAVDQALNDKTAASENPISSISTGKLVVKSKAPRNNSVRILSANSRIIPVGITLIFLGIFGLALVNSWSQSNSTSIIPIFQQFPLLIGDRNSPAVQTRKAEGATATIQALQIRLPTRTPTASPTTTPANTEEPTRANVDSEPVTAAPTSTPTPITAPTNPPPLPLPTETDTPTNTAVPSPLPSVTNSPPPPGPTTPPTPSPTSAPQPTDTPEPTDTPLPTPTPPLPPTPTPPIFPTNTPVPTGPPTQF